MKENTPQNKTPLGQLQERLEHWLSVNKEINPKTNSDARVVSAKIVVYIKCLEELQSLLPVEREAIEAAYRDGHYDCADEVGYYGGELYIPKLNEDYFTQTYGIPTVSEKS